MIFECQDDFLLCDGLFEFHFDKNLVSITTSDSLTLDIDFNCGRHDTVFTSFAHDMEKFLNDFFRFTRNFRIWRSITSIFILKQLPPGTGKRLFATHTDLDDIPLT